ncbi:MAG: hypothetical protein C4526_10745 [Nitrospiraceae bacterium]|nr:MAG: hypothetical protein C4526_10745 [Nitrospiraceae bacterium]
MNNIFSNIPVLYKHYKATSAILRKVFKYPLTPDKSGRIIADRLSRRNENFLETVEKTIYSFSSSPYRLLLDRAGYGFQDVYKLVMTRGIEDALGDMYSKGVYIDILEFKGKKTAVRGEASFNFREKDFSNPLLTTGLDTKSGGTRSSGTSIVVPLEYIEQHNVYGVFAARENNMMKNPAVIWLPILPAGEGLFFNLRFAAMGNPPVKWFSQVDEKYIKPSATDKLKTKTSIWTAALYGKKIPAPEFIDMRKTVNIARWMDANLGNAPGFSVVTYASSALRLITEAKKHNFRLGETAFWLMGEPLTDKISEEIRDFGCRAYSLYGCNELMIIGQGCANPRQPDDMHFCKDKLAVLQRKTDVEHSDVSVDAFYFSTILKSSPKIFLNTQTGDYGVIEKRSCGCGFEKLGFTEHIHTVRSFEKLTAEGATFIGSDLIPLVQKVLPSEFGGNATDYQFVEEPDESGFPRLFILVSPDLGGIDDNRLKELVFETMGSGEYSHAYSRSYWSQADTIRIKREYPVPTARGKIVPLHIRKRTG